MIGVVSGLKYLHMSRTPLIVHDLKPANVLLDDDMEARIANFGLAKSILNANTHMKSSNIAGTCVGHGKFPSDDVFQYTMKVNLVKWMRNVMTYDNHSQAIDPSLMRNSYGEQMILVLKVASFYTLDNSKERPNSKAYRAMLAQIKQ
ncbi:leucine-rich repeat receptor-like serine/threonine/tyrosine-protein kinase SOBIR1 [Tanacetum coccineum]